MVINWVLFIGMVAYIYTADYLLNKFLMEEYAPNVEVNNEIEKINKKPIKTIKEQIKYIKLNEKKEQIIGGGFGKFMYIILMVIIFSILLDYAPKKYLVVFSIGFVVMVSLVYVILTRKYNNIIVLTYNFISSGNMALFLVVFIIMEKTNPLMSFGYKINILLFIPFFLVLNFIILKIKEKVYKFKGGVLNYGTRKGEKI